MNDVLSQSEIDDLLNALSTGDVIPEEPASENKSKVRYKKYDVRSPKRFSKDDITTLKIVHENYARVISSFLSAQVRSNIQAKVELVDQITYEEFIKSISVPTILCSYKMPPLNGTLLFETSPQFVFQILDIMLGGEGKSVYKVRDFTEIEKNIIRVVDSKLIENLKVAWEETLKVNPELISMETNPALNQTMAPNEPVAIIVMSVNINGIKSLINMCIPYLAVENTLSKLVAKNWDETIDRKDRAGERNQLERNIQDVSLCLTAVLGKVVIPLKDFINLQPGDVIQLDRNVEDPVDLFVDSKLHYKAVPGTFKKNKAVKVVEIIDKDVEENE